MDQHAKQIVRDAWLAGYTAEELIITLDMVSRSRRERLLGLRSREAIAFYMTGMTNRLEYALIKNPSI